MIFTLQPIALVERLRRNFLSVLSGNGTSASKFSHQMLTPGILVATRKDGEAVFMSSVSSGYEPLGYTLLNWFGEPGWGSATKDVGSSDTKDELHA